MSFDFVKMGQRLEKLQEWSENQKLIFSTAPVKRMINEMQTLYDENCRLRRELASLKGETLTRPVSCQQRLMEEGKPYPRSGCNECKKEFWQHCPYDVDQSTVDDLVKRMNEQD